MSKPEPLQYNQYYHIYNRGNSGEILFREARNYPYFLELYARYVEPVAETYAYCLMSNHFHLLVRIKSLKECQKACQSRDAILSKDRQTHSAVYPSRAFSNLFSTYTKAFNKTYQRTGSLFEKPFRRELVDNDRYFAALVTYIHHNPQAHGFVPDFRDWPHSSYQAIVSDKPTRLQRDAVLDWFGGRVGLEEFHLVEVDEETRKPRFVDDAA